MIAQNNVTHMFVGSATAMSVVNAPTVARTLGKKLVGEQLCEAGALVAGNRFQILYMDSGGTLQHSPVLNWSNLLYRNRVTTVAATTQRVVVGFNGTAGSIEVNNSENYLITMSYRDQLSQFSNKSFYKYAEYTSGAAATQYAIATGLVTSFRANCSRDPYRMFYAERINSGVSTATSGGALTVTNGSVTVTTVESAGGAADAGLYNADAGTMVAGDLIRFGHATTNTFAVYKIAAITIAVGGATATITLDVPYEGASGAVAAANAGVVPIANEGNYGVRIIANDGAKELITGRFNYSPMRFDLGLSTAFGDTITTVEAIGSKGHGTFNDVAQMEYELIANRMEPYKIAEYPISFNLGATAGETYTLYTLQFKDESTQTIGGTADSFITLVIASAGGNLTVNADTVFGF